jgi:hypothetical protein
MSATMLAESPNCSQSVSYRLTSFFARVISSTLKMEKTRSSETSVFNKPTRRQIREEGILKILLFVCNIKRRVIYIVIRKHIMYM